MQSQDIVFVPVDELQVGMYVHLDLKWFEHPFAFNHFKIKDAEQIAVIRSLGVEKVRYDPTRSDRRSAEPEEEAPPPPPELPDVPREHPALAAKRVLIEKIREQREAAARIEHVFVDTARTIQGIEKNLLGNPEQSVRQASELVEQIADSILSAPDLAIHVMGDKIGGEELYFHSLNVTMLALMVARDIKLPQEAMQALGMGALFHDVGRREIPNKILMKQEPLTQAEQNFYALHCQYAPTSSRRSVSCPRRRPSSSSTTNCTTAAAIRRSSRAMPSTRWRGSWPSPITTTSCATRTTWPTRRRRTRPSSP